MLSGRLQGRTRWRPSASATRDGIGRPGMTSPILALDPLLPCSFGLLPNPRSEPCVQFNHPLGVTVTVRWIPLVTAAYGTRVARPARTTTLLPDGDGTTSAGG
jgi:hypothetical protein